MKCVGGWVVCTYTSGNSHYYEEYLNKNPLKCIAVQSQYLKFGFAIYNYLYVKNVKHLKNRKLLHIFGDSDFGFCGGILRMILKF
jgi:hypothetical protein